MLSSKYLITDKNRLKYIMREKQIEDEIMEHNRLITFDGTVNFRDIGGYENNEGKHVKWGKIYRSDSLSSLTKRDEEKLEEMKVTVDCDLRTSNEQLMAPDRQWNGVEVWIVMSTQRIAAVILLMTVINYIAFYIIFLKLTVIWVKFTKT